MVRFGYSRLTSLKMATRIPTVSSQNVRNVSPEELYNVICAATSQDPAQVKASSDRLREMLEMLGSFDTLSQIAAQRTLPIQIRQQAIIQLKNSSIGHWKSRKYVTVHCLSLETGSITILVDL